MACTRPTWNVRQARHTRGHLPPLLPLMLPPSLGMGGSARGGTWGYGEWLVCPGYDARKRRFTAIGDGGRMRHRILPGGPDTQTPRKGDDGARTLSGRRLWTNINSFVYQIKRCLPLWQAHFHQRKSLPPCQLSNVVNGYLCGNLSLAVALARA